MIHNLKFINISSEGGGTTWSSAKVEKGSITTYGKDIKEKFSSNNVQTMSRPTVTIPTTTSAYPSAAGVNTITPSNPKLKVPSSSSYQQDECKLPPPPYHYNPHSARGVSSSNISSHSSTTKPTSKYSKSNPASSSRSDIMISSGVVDVGGLSVDDWLCSIGMGQYVNTFTQNDITSALLQDLSLSDLDYMGITVLGAYVCTCECVTVDV